MKTIPLLGKKVKFVRVTADGQAIDGEGILTAWVLFDGRIQAVVVEDKQQYKIDGQGINVDSAEARQQYIDHVAKIRAYADEANKRNAEAVKEANGNIEKMNAQYMGPRIEP